MTTDAPPAPSSTPVLLAGDPVRSLDDYRRRGGLAGYEAAAALGPTGVIEQLTASGLRGRGGAGFPVGVKWGSIVAGGPAAGDRFVVANGAEGEPGTFKDRAILRHDPYPLVEGLLIAAETLGAARAFVALKRSFAVEAERVAAAAMEFAAAGLGRGVSIELVQGPDEYLFGEEKALLEVIEGEEPLPRLFPPYIYGLFSRSPQMGWSAGSTLDDADRDGSNPTLVNNIESLSLVPLILGRGVDWFRSTGTTESPGHLTCTVSGDTVRDGVGEYPMGTPLSTVIDELGGGLAAGRAVKYVLSGVSNPVIRADHLDVPLTYEHVAAIGSGLGTAGFLVYDDRTDPVELAEAVSRFLAVESCGQCPACKLGTGRITEILASQTALNDPELPIEAPVLGELSARLANVTDSSRCFLPAQAQRLVASLVPDMRDPTLRTPKRGLLITKIVDLVAGDGGGRFALDERQRRKRPDWTYEPE
ncbi:MAG: NADH-ubiquinone oxidoreductase-F iron-sulfur binding region domain-containing protein [Actinomycetota bacterium]